jgi:lyso-ornithine lipid O-acyltransferase
MSKLRGITTTIGFLGLTLPLMPIQAALKVTSQTAARRFPHTYHRLLCKVLGLRVHVEGTIPRKPCLIVANHVSWLDIPCISAVLPVSFVARHDMAQWPLFGSMAKLQQTVLVDRSRKSKTGDVRDEMATRLASGDTLVLFPEGTSHDGINVRPFKSSFFAIAEQHGIEIVPATLAYRGVGGLPMTRRQRPSFAWYGDMDMVQHLWGAVSTGGVDVTIRFHDALPQGKRKDLAKQAEQQVRAALGPMLHGTPQMR